MIVNKRIHIKLYQYKLAVNLNKNSLYHKRYFSLTKSLLLSVLKQNVIKVRIICDKTAHARNNEQ